MTRIAHLRDEIALSEERRAHAHTKRDRDNLLREMRRLVDAARAGDAITVERMHHALSMRESLEEAS